MAGVWQLIVNRMHARAGPQGGQMLHMTAGAVRLICPLGGLSWRSGLGAVEARGGRIPTPAPQALREASVGAETGSVREGRSEARVTVWRAALMKQPARPAPGGSGATNYSRQDAVRTF